MKRGWDSGQAVYSSLNNGFSFSGVSWELTGSGPGEGVFSGLGGEQIYSPAPSAPAAPKWRCPRWMSVGGAWAVATPS